MEGMILIVGIVFVLWILKKMFTSSDKVWKQAKKYSLKKTDSSSENCSRCIYRTCIITPSKVICSKKDIEVTENMVCSEFEGSKLKSSQHSLFGS